MANQEKTNRKQNEESKKDLGRGKENDNLQGKIFNHVPTFYSFLPSHQPNCLE